ncbi:MAG: ferritin family protein [bacterium]
MTLHERNSGIDEVEALAKHEEVIRDLYVAYARRFPEHVTFWEQLANEEQAHAGWIRNLLRNAEDGELHIVPGRFRSKAIETSMKYLRDEAEKARMQEIDISYAAAIAREVESALIDRKFFEIFDTDSTALQDTLTALQNATKEHRKKVDEFFDEIKKAGN